MVFGALMMRSPPHSLSMFSVRASAWTERAMVDVSVRHSNVVRTWSADAHPCCAFPSNHSCANSVEVTCSALAWCSVQALCFGSFLSDRLKFRAGPSA
jgi:hypothetical protein